MKTGSKRTILYGIGMVALIGVTLPLLGSDNVPFLKWWMMALLMGIGFYPLTRLFFSPLEDQGWIFSKVLGVALSGFLTWVLVCSGLAKFTQPLVLVVTLAAMALCWIFLGRKKGEKPLNLNLMLGEELLFLALFLLWTYIAGFRPEATGTEKFMDYGFMAAMMRSDSLPARDIWYGLENINYYYGGQYYAVFLTKLTFTQVRDTYNLMRAFVAGFTFVLPFSIVWHMLQSKIGSQPRRGWIPPLGGILAGTAVSLAGNMHYVLYGLLGKVTGLSDPSTDGYWFSSSTRFIGHNPETSDQCIHEFPSYSFILGDLHAHVINLFFVLTAIGLVYAWMKQLRDPGTLRKGSQAEGNQPEVSQAEGSQPAVLQAEGGRSALAEAERESRQGFCLRKTLLQPQLLALGIFTGIFRWTNYWDFVIYDTVILICIVFQAIYAYQRQWRPALLTIILQAGEVFLLGSLAALPFTLSFETMISGVALCQNHSAFYQLLILWGLPVALVVLLLVAVLVHFVRNSKKGGRFFQFFRQVPFSDQFALILGICGIGLVLIPELVYVRDIYENGYARANTMFKLTYQAYLLFGLSISYAIPRLLTWGKALFWKLCAGLGLVLELMTCGYFPCAVSMWYGNILDRGEYRCLDATAYLVNVYPEDAEAIHWLNENVEGNPIVLEANGDSYSQYCRVSAMTGLPTVLGWYVHEWLWRNDTTDLNQKAADIQTIYTSNNLEEVEDLLEQYQVRYIFLGSCEREKYEDLNESLLLQTGTVVYGDPASGNAYIIEVDP